MWIWAVIIVSGICAFLSFYMGFLGFRLGDSGVFMFSGFGLFSGIFFVTSIIKVAAKKSAFIKSIDDKISGKPEPVSFVPHWFIMTALIIAGIGILAVMLIPIFFR